MSFTFRGILFSIVSASIFGLMPIFAKYVYADGCSAAGLVFLRMSFGAIVLFFLAKRNVAQPWRISSKQLKKILTLSAGFGPTPLLLYMSYDYISTGAATTIHFVYPAFAFLICWLFYKEKPNQIQIISLALCTLGVVLFYKPGDDGSLFGVFIAFLSGLTYAFYAVYLDKSGIREMDKFHMNFYMSFISALMMVSAAVPLGIFSLPNTLSGWIISFVFAILMTVIAGILFQMGVNYIGPQKATIFSTFEPLTSVIVGVLFLSEQIDLFCIIGIGVILLAVFLLIFAGNRDTNS